MTDAILQQLIQGGAMGVFAAFLVWQFMGMQKRLDKLVDSFQGQLKTINADYDQRIEAMRERYDVVIGQYRDEVTVAQKELFEVRQQITVEVSDKIAENTRKLDEALGKLDEGLIAMRSMMEEARLKEAARRGPTP